VIFGILNHSTSWQTTVFIYHGYRRIFLILKPRKTMSFKALLVEKDDEGKTSASIQTLDDSQLPDGDVTVAVEYSTVNYKDGLCVGPGGGLVRNYPHIPGIDFAGTVIASDSKVFSEGDKVVLTGWRVGEAWWGGYSQKARVKSEWLVPLPDGVSTRQAMAVGTAGFTAMLSVMALEAHGLKPGNGPVLVTGAAGGVGSVATAILANLGYEVAAVTGRPETSDYLKSLGATTIVAREEINETVKRPLEVESWAGCIDAVGGSMLARVLGQMKYGASVAAVGLAGGANLPTTVIPFLLRGVNLLGIDSVMQPYENRLAAWKRLQHLPIYPNWVHRF
jgi:acrylyl-CoA reductase (NADPH)